MKAVGLASNSQILIVINLFDQKVAFHPETAQSFNNFFAYAYFLFPFINSFILRGYRAPELLTGYMYFATDIYCLGVTVGHSLLQYRGFQVEEEWDYTKFENLAKSSAPPVPSDLLDFVKMTTLPVSSPASINPHLFLSANSLN